MRNILLPSAKLVPEELRHIGKLPPIIYPINDEIVFDCLYRQYKDIAERIDVICYEKSSAVHDRIGNYISQKVCVVDLPYLDDLGHTIYFGLKEIKDDSVVVVNFADTIVMDNIYDFKNEDCYFYAEDFHSETWTFFEEKGGGNYRNL